MAAKTIYFIRHGETHANRRHYHQGPDEPLSERGREQVVALVPTLQTLGIETLATSSFVRARQTAEIIGESLALPYTIVDEVKEFLRPTSLYGKHHVSFGSLRYIANLFLHQDEPEWEEEGAENLFHVRNRMRTAQQVIESLPGERIAVVSHAIFMDMFTQMVCADRDLTLPEFLYALALSRKTPNTGMIQFTLDDYAPAGTCKWFVEATTFVLPSQHDT